MKADVQKNWTTCVPISDELPQVPGEEKIHRSLRITLLFLYFTVVNKVCEWDLSSNPKILSIMAHVIQIYKLKFDQLLIYKHVAPKSLK